MKIISLNTWAGVALEPLLAFFKKYQDTDIFCLQEVYKDAEGKAQPHPILDMKLDLYKRIEAILKDTHDGYFRPAYKDYYGQAMFVKKGVPVQEEGDILIYDNPNNLKRGEHSRNAQYVSTTVNDKPVLVLNVHGLWNGQGKTDTEDRLEQSRKIRAFVDGRKEQIVMIGDFNLSPTTESIAFLENGMKNLINEYGVTSTRTSLYAKEEKFADYAFVSSDVQVVDFKVLPDEASDHAALFLEIT